MSDTEEIKNHSNGPIKNILEDFKKFIRVVALRENEYLEASEKLENAKESFEIKILRLTRTVLFFAFLSFGTFSAYEAWRVYSEYCDEREAISNLQYVAEKIYYEDSAPDVSLELLLKTEEMDENNIKTKYIRSFIESMVIADRLLDLDREYNAKELKEAQYALANAYFLIEDAQRGDTSETFRGLIYNKLGISGSNHEADGYFTRAQIYLALKDYTRAMDNIDKALSLVENNEKKKIYFQIRKATIMVKFERYDEAIVLLNNYKNILEKKELVDKDKLFLAQVYNWLGYANMKKFGENNSSANSYFLEALKIDDKYLDALYNYAEYLVYKLDENYEVADIFEVEKYILRMLKVNPDYKYAYYLWAYMYGKIDQYDVSEKYCDIALQIDDGYFDATLLKSRVLYEKDDYPQALETINKALSLKPKNVEAHYRKGMIETLQKNYKEAIKSFDYVDFFSKEGEKQLAYYALSKKASLLLEQNKKNEFDKTIEKIKTDYKKYIDYRFWLLINRYSILYGNEKDRLESKKELSLILKTVSFSSKSISNKIKAQLKLNNIKE